jgi:hypothetical protein
VDAEHLRRLARDCELQAAQSGEHIDWKDLSPEICHAIQQEVWSGIAFVLNEVADTIDAEEREAA